MMKERIYFGRAYNKTTIYAAPDSCPVVVISPQDEASTEKTIAHPGVKIRVSNNYNQAAVDGGHWEKYRRRVINSGSSGHMSKESLEEWRRREDEFERKQQEEPAKTAEQERLERASTGIGNIYKGDV